jgi:hypothetical protein
MPWWSEPNRPESSDETDVASTETETLSEEGKRKAWRMLALIDAFRALHADPLSLDEIDLLGRVAEANFDLHDACGALRNGCSLDYLVVIFT